MTRDEKNGRPRGGSAPRRDSATKANPPKADVTLAVEVGDERQRIAKLMARAGLCSRRDAESWILEGRVSVNGAVLTSPALDVGATDVVLVDGEPLPAADKTRLFLFHKPSGLITSDHDPEGRETVFDYLRDNWPDGPRVVTIGRLDFNTEGLLLLTNDGGLARILELPKTGWVRRYRVRAKGTTDQGVLDGLAHGVTIDGIEYAGIEAKLDRIQGANCWLTMGLREGKNREVKRVLEHIGLDVNRLIRLSFGPFQLLDLPEGHVEEVKTRILRDQLGPTLAAQAGVDFTEAEALAPIVAAPKAGPSKPSARVAGRDRAPRTPPARDAKSAGHGRAFRDRDTESETPVAPEIRERPVAGSRKHVSTLRAQTGVALRTGPRTRLERTDTTDRKNRTVAVERRVSTAPVIETRPKPARRERPDSPARRERPDSPARRERPDSPARRERPDNPARRERPDSPARRERPESPARRERSDSPARRERPDSPARRERPDSPARRERPDSPARRERPETSPARRERPDSPARRERSDNPARRERPDSPARRERPETSPARRERSDSPARRERPDSPARRERSDNPARRERPDSPARRERIDSPARRERPESPARRFAGEARASQAALGKRERVARSGGEARAARPERSFSDERPKRSAPRGPRGEAGDAPRPARSAGKTFGDRPSGGRPATGRVVKRSSDKPRGRERSDDRPVGDRPARGLRGGQSVGDRPPRSRVDAGEKRAPRANRPAGRGGDKPARPPRGPSGARPPRKPR